MRNVATAKVEGVEFTRMGQKGILGRYPLHFHLMKNKVNDGFYAKHNSFHHNYQRCIAIHDTNGITVQWNVAYNTTGHCYFLEDGAEMYNLFEDNLGITALKGNLIPSDEEPTLYWITNPVNTFRRNVAVGGTFGFWYSLPLHPIGASAPDYVNSNTVWPRWMPLLELSNNVAHSAQRTGLMVN